MRRFLRSLLDSIHLLDILCETIMRRDISFFQDAYVNCGLFRHFTVNDLALDSSRYRGQARRAKGPNSQRPRAPFRHRALQRKMLRDTSRHDIRAVLASHEIKCCLKSVFRLLKEAGISRKRMKRKRGSKNCDGKTNKHQLSDKGCAPHREEQGSADDDIRHRRIGLHLSVAEKEYRRIQRGRRRLHSGC